MLWDDAGHVTRADLRSLSGLVRIWTELGATQQYYPVLHSAFWFEHALWGDAVVPYHLLNICLHATAACLFGTLLRRLAIPGAWLAAALFTLHPVCVESVAWIAEQKNTLSAVFYLGAALAWLRFESDRRPRRWAIATGWFVLALLTKTVTASLPAALLVLTWWRQGRLDWRRDVRPLLPWFAAALGMGLLTAQFERDLIGAQGADFTLDAVQRTLLAGRVVWFYLGKLLWPVDLLFIYPRWTVDAGVAWQWLFPLAALGLVGGLVWWRRHSRAPLAAALLFGGTLFPVLGFVNVFPFVFSYVADHFQYLASLAAFAFAGAGLTALASRLPAGLVRPAGAVLLATLGALTWFQCGMYRDNFTLFETNLRANPDSWMAHHNLALALTEVDRVAEAVPHLETVLRLKPDYAPAANNLGNNLLRLNRANDALPWLERATALQPKYAAAHCNLGLALATLDRTAEALPHFEQAVRLDRTYAEAELNLGLALMLLGRFPAAGPHFENALRLQPGSARNFHTYGRALERNGQLEAAIARYTEAVRLDPDSADAHFHLALALRNAGRMHEATPHFLAVERLNPALLQRR